LLEVRGAARLDMGRLREGREDLLAALAGYQESSNPVREGRALFTLASKLIDAGYIREAEGYLSQAGRLWRQGDSRPMLANLHNSWALFYSCTGDQEAARSRAEQALVLARECGDPAAECAAMVTLAEALIAAGHSVEADHYAATAVELSERLGMGTTLNSAIQARIGIAVARRDRTGARNLIEDARPHAVTPVDTALLDLLDGMAALRSRAFGRSSVLLERAEERLTAVNRHHYAARACLLRAEALLASGTSSKAENALNRMTDLIEPLGCEAFLWPAARMTRQVLSERHRLRRLRRDTRQVLDRMAEAVPILSLVLSSDEEDRAPALRLSPFGEGLITLGEQRISNS
ncbi:MAG: hypothetical protein ACRDGS_09855, partial [Chloroflexota bacterium]